MSPGIPASTQRNRLDHILPQGYLDGFTHPQRGNLSVFDIRQQRWFQSGTKSVAAARGFYDYSSDSAPDQTADESFAKYESRFPAVRRELVATGFAAWTSHRDFLLEFAQMLRARSELFREHSLIEARQSTLLRVTEVLQSEPGKTVLKYEPVVQSEAERDTLLRNLTITKMRGEIAKGSAMFANFNWCLRHTTDPANPVITADNAVVVVGKALTLPEALEDLDTVILFPLCWQACLIGSLSKFAKDTEAFDPLHLRTIQKRYLDSECRFAYSPTPVASTSG